MNELYHIVNSSPEIFQWVFHQKPKNLYEITEYFADKQLDLIKLLSILNMAESLRKADCLGIQEKFRDAANWNKLITLESELFFANEFVRLGFSVAFIADSSPEWTKNSQTLPSPDLCVERHGQQMLIEVARISGDETISEIENLLDDSVRKTRSCVSIDYSEAFSIPVINNDERQQRELLIQEFAKLFKEKITDISEEQLPLSIEIMGCKVAFTQSPIKKGSFSGNSTAALLNPHGKVEPQIAYILESKAKKRIRFPEHKKNKPYLVALDIQQEWFCSNQHLISFLFGGLHYRPPHERTIFSDPPAVVQAKENGWRNFLETVGFDGDSINQDGSPGLLLTNSTVSKNLTGILVRNNEKLEFVPNPFAENMVNCPHLCTVLPLLCQRSNS